MEAGVRLTSPLAWSASRAVIVTLTLSPSSWFRASHCSLPLLRISYVSGVNRLLFVGLDELYCLLCSFAPFLNRANNSIPWVIIQNCHKFSKTGYGRSFFFLPCVNIQNFYVGRIYDETRKPFTKLPVRAYPISNRIEIELRERSVTDIFLDASLCTVCPSWGCHSLATFLVFTSRRDYERLVSTSKSVESCKTTVIGSSYWLLPEKETLLPLLKSPSELDLLLKAELMEGFTAAELSYSTTAIIVKTSLHYL